MTDFNARRAVVEFARRTYEKGLVAATDGNLSHRIARDRVLVTPSGFCLGEIGPDDLCVVSLDGRNVAGAHEPTSETPMHLEVYRRRPDVQAVVHAHPPITNAFSFAGQELDPCVIPEVVVSLGRVPTAPYSTPSCEEGPAAIRDLIRGHDAIILARHGTLTVGKTMREAYYRTEKLEHAAEVLFAARQLGPIQPLSADELRRLADVCERHGWRKREFIYRACGRSS
ncbi:MAG: class II aldolase/adducin family protein [Planctomycetota bacterium]|nr:MAG: class II aldolase/adducin family protein [Planctomycetota bacterium]